MKFSLRAPLAALATLTLTAGIAQADASDYTCKDVLGGLLGCYTEYTGPVTPEAAALYLDDADALLQDLMAERPDIEKASYEPKTGRLLLISQNGMGPNRIMSADVAKMFAEKHVYLSQVMVKTSEYGFVTRADEIQYNPGGRSRLFALLGVKFESDLPRGTSGTGFAALGEAETDVFGNMVTRF